MLSEILLVRRVSTTLFILVTSSTSMPRVLTDGDGALVEFPSPMPSFALSTTTVGDMLSIELILIPSSPSALTPGFRSGKDDLETVQREDIDLIQS